MLEVDCTELSTDETLALAASLDDSLEGRVVAFVKGDSIALDQIGEDRVRVEELVQAVNKFIAARKDAAHYSVETEGEKVTVRSPDPVAAKAGKRPARLPDNVWACPFCPFVTPYEEMYNVHFRSHLF